MTEDPEFAAALERHRAEIRAEREAQDARLAAIIERFASRGKYTPRNLPAVETHDFKLSAANDS